MRTTITIQEEGYTPYIITISDEVGDKEFPYEVHLSRAGHAGEGAEFKEDELKEISEWIAKWIEDYLGYVKLEDNK